ncbi:MAG: PQQ-dependent sugar dehydrogenase [Bacteroidetes bacterium]|nr:PQQ-dependent sugar dehydrogenase [Bacteroidota bacterium]MDA1122098.1 PQQ-dependent sugar dehydrogenase [Bacteroidota bacterium]
MIRSQYSLIAAFAIIQSCQAKPPHPGAAVYQTYCTGCHGAQMQGSLAAPLIKTDWIYGRGKGNMMRNVRYGIAGTQMAEWDQVLTREQISDVVDYIFESQDVPPSAERSIPDQIETENYVLKIEKFGKGLSKPWGIEFIDDTTALISEGTGGLRWLINNELDTVPISGIPVSHMPYISSGMLDLAIDPDYANNGWVYLSYSYTKDTVDAPNSVGMTKIVRGRVKDHEWVNEQVLFEAPESFWLGRARQWGCRFLFDNEGYLYFSIGDMSRDSLSQNITHPAGNVFRINPDGTVPKDNPFVGVPGAFEGIYSLGNRNVQGIAQDPVSGTIWMTEHGPMGGDELNILEKGQNYGWPLATFGRNYNGNTISNTTTIEGMKLPVTYWTPSIGVCPVEVSTSSLFPKWKGNLLVGALAQEEIKRLVVEGDSIAKEEVFLKGLGRVRDIKTHPDGSIYVLLNQPDWVIRLTPEGNL